MMIDVLICVLSAAAMMLALVMELRWLNVDLFPRWWKVWEWR